MNSYKLAATILVFLAVLLRALLNHKMTKLDIDKMIISVPAELTFLILGFLLPELSNQTSENDIFSHVIPLFVVLLLLIIQYAVEKWMEDTLTWTTKKIFLAIVMYLVSIGTYYLVVWKGI